MTVLGQRFRAKEQEEEGPRPVFPSQAEFHFIRLEYTDVPEYHRFFGFASRGAQGEGWWVMDWPDADDHFSHCVERLTRIGTGDPRHMRFTGDRLFDYPWVYATQTGPGSVGEFSRDYAASPIYPAEMTALAYRHGINYLIYSIMH